MSDHPLIAIPRHLHAEILHIWEAEVSGGAARYQATKCRRGIQGQKKVSALLKDHGVLPETDGRWEAVRAHGEKLYRGQPTPPWPPEVEAAPTSTTPPSPAPAARVAPAPRAPKPQPVVPGHESTLAYMASPAFAQRVAAHDEALGRGRLFYRLTSSGVVMIGLHPDAPGFVGFQSDRPDHHHTVVSATPIPSTDELRARWQAYGRFLAGVERISREEQGVIPLLCQAMQGKLLLPLFGPDWALLAHEWRFLNDDGRGKKSDLLMVHLPTGRLGIVELKSKVSDLDDAAIQVRDYARFWARDAEVLAPFFSRMLQVQGRLFGNEAATNCVVSTQSARLFVGAVGPGAEPVWHELR